MSYLKVCFLSWVPQNIHLFLGLLCLSFEDQGQEHTRTGDSEQLSLIWDEFHLAPVAPDHEAGQSVVEFSCGESL